MGLDIYLYSAAQAAQNAAYDAAVEDLYAEGPDGKTKRDAMSDDEYRAWSKQYEYAGRDDSPSERYPEHLCDRRYLRSSYNEGGFNHAVPQMMGTAESAEYPDARGSLYWIFEPMGRDWRSGDDGDLTAEDVEKLKASRARAVEIVEELSKSDLLRVTTISPNMFSAPPTTTDAEALAMYRAEVTNGRIGDAAWSNAAMETFGKGGMTFLAAVPGKAVFGVPGVHLIYRNESADWYRQAAEIVVEFCDEAIMLIRRDGSCSMSWSG